MVDREGKSCILAPEGGLQASVQIFQESETENMATASNAASRLERNPSPPEPVDERDARMKKSGIFFYLQS